MGGQFIFWLFYKKNLEMYFMNNNNASGGNPFEQIYHEIISNMLTSGTDLNAIFNTQMSNLFSNAISNNANLFGELGALGVNFWRQYSNLQTENERLQTENAKLKKDNSDLNQKYQNACLSSKSALEAISQKNNVIKKHKETIDELKQKLNVQSNESEIATQNKKSNNVFSIDQNNSISLLGKIKSLKDNLKLCKVVDYSYSGNNKNQQTK